METHVSGTQKTLTLVVLMTMMISLQLLLVVLALVDVEYWKVIQVSL